jgi:murein L,D-transpeptidase YcbB/YkuD
VNIPEYRLHVLADGREIASHRVIVGKPSTPTPQFSAQVTAVIFNPPWNVPQSIIAESVGRLIRNSPEVARARGYTWSYAGGGLRVTQQPGPGNALGQMKLDMPNPFTVYLHDTSNRELFDNERRTLSHGCVRTDKPFKLAKLLLPDGSWTQSRIDAILETRRTTRAALERPMPVYTVYMTAFAAADGTITYSDDPYSLDAAISRLLDDGAGPRTG